MAKKNWDRIRNQKATETVKYRDVYEDQQLERSSIAKKENMFSRTILALVAAVAIFILFWFVISAVDLFRSPKDRREYTLNPADNWIYVNEYYANKNDYSDKLTPSEYEELLADYDPSLPEIEEPVAPNNPNNFKKDFQGDWVYKDRDTGAVYTPEEWEALKVSYEADRAQYEEDLAYYKDYCRRRVNPADTYTYQVAHYRSRFDTNVYIVCDEYNKLVEEYEAKKAKGKFSEDELNVPVMPINPEGLYSVYSYSYQDVLDINDLVGDTFEDSAETETAETDAETGVERVPSVYINNLDATKISAYEYDMMMNEYTAAVEVYKEAYQAHREKYHPDDIDGTARTMDMGFTGNKFLISFCAAGLTFALLYYILSNNLKAQNLMSDTSDINQYHNDQHVALPEEVQRNYDWFPDVGAHSAVQVSSMISHMALQNKGLKKVDLAKRADKDIVDQDGNIEYYKGEILRDENGNPITSNVPIIDTEFMDALFDASGAPKDKEVRRSYDTTKIPYNPDGSNRDKLGKYATVADLINEDWEFPIYEPQRPGGAYIVDTAPVNTMVLAITRAGKGKFSPVCSVMSKSCMLIALNS